MSVVLVVGLQWGDEGKGKIVDWLASGAAHVARFQGGHNAGHTLIADNKKFALHLLPSGVLHKKVKCYIGGGVVVSPTALLAEITTLSAAGVSLTGRFYISSSSALVLPFHVEKDQRRESKKNNIGTTLLGIGPAHEDKTARRAVRLYDLYNGTGKDKLAACAAAYSDCPSATDIDKLWADLQKQGELLRPFICDNISELLWAARDNKEQILLEGAQGVMLDIEQGTYPYVTAAQCLPAAAAGGLGADLFPDILGVTKAYATRVGNGPFPTEECGDLGSKIASVGEEVGATTGRARRCGWLDIPMLRHALRISGCCRLALTKLDVFDSFDEIKICTAYQLDNKQLQFPPSDPAALSRCRPEYETFPGWSEHTAGLTADEKLPANARRYIERIAELTGTTIDIISTGPQREKSIVRRHPFAD